MGGEPAHLRHSVAFAGDEDCVRRNRSEVLCVVASSFVQKHWYRSTSGAASGTKRKRDDGEVRRQQQLEL